VIPIHWPGKDDKNISWNRRPAFSYGISDRGTCMK
jgi:hypothetical protein